MILKDHPVTTRIERTGYYKPVTPWEPKTLYINACDVCLENPYEAVIEDKGTKLCEEHAKENGITIL